MLPGRKRSPNYTIPLNTSRARIYSTQIQPSTSFFFFFSIKFVYDYQSGHLLNLIEGNFMYCKVKVMSA